MRIQFVSQSEGHAGKGCSISGILGWPNKTRSDAAGVLLAGWECAHCARVREGMALSARRTAAPAATASVAFGGSGVPHGGRPGWAARPRHSGQPGWPARPHAYCSPGGGRGQTRWTASLGCVPWHSGQPPWAARPRHGGQPGWAARPRGGHPGWATRPRGGQPSWAACPRNGAQTGWAARPRAAGTLVGGRVPAAGSLLGGMPFEWRVYWLGGAPPRGGHPHLEARPRRHGCGGSLGALR